MSAGLNSVRKRGMSGRILTESGLQFLNCTIKILLLWAIFVPCPAALRECFPCKRSSLWSIWGGQTTTWHSSELKNVSCWFIFSGAVPSLCSSNQFWEKNGNSLENRNQVLFFLHFYTHRQLQGRAGFRSFFGSQLYLHVWLLSIHSSSQDANLSHAESPFLQI